jgi:hypothetical protein
MEVAGDDVLMQSEEDNVAVQSNSDEIIQMLTSLLENLMKLFCLFGGV